MKFLLTATYLGILVYRVFIENITPWLRQLYLPVFLSLTIIYLALFVLALKDKADAIRIILVSVAILPQIPLYLTPILWITGCLLNDEYLRRVARWRLIVLTGIDGSGKTSHSGDVARYIESRLNVEVRYYHFFEHRLLSSLGILYAKLRGKPIIRHNAVGGDEVYTNHFRKRVRVSSAILRPLILLLDNWMYIGFRLLRNFLRGRWVLCDRYFYDYFIRLKVLGYPVPRVLDWLVFKLTPRPHLLLILDVNPLLSYRRRDGEHPLWYYVMARKFFHKLAREMHGIIINTERPYNKSQALINAIVEDTLIKPLLKNKNHKDMKNL